MTLRRPLLVHAIECLERRNAAGSRLDPLASMLPGSRDADMQTCRGRVDRVETCTDNDSTGIPRGGRCLSRDASLTRPRSADGDAH